MPEATKSDRSAANDGNWKKSVEIVFSADEITFLKKITGEEFKEVPREHSAAQLSLREKLNKVDVDEDDSGELNIVGVTHPELAFLQHTTKEVYAFITAEERRARLILREKMRVSQEKLEKMSEEG